jgi:hypothetical protein
MMSCTERFRAAGVDASKLSPGNRGRLEGYDFIVARDDTSAEKICARVDAEKQKTVSMQESLNRLNEQLNEAQKQVAELRSGGTLKENYLVVEGCLLGWAVVASIWASYFAGRLDPRRH